MFFNIVGHVVKKQLRWSALKKARAGVATFQKKLRNREGSYETTAEISRL